MSQQTEKSWMFEDRFSHVYRTRVDSFIAFAYKNRTIGSQTCPCPYRVCRNAKSKKFELVRHDLKVNGMLVTYVHWSLHGEKPTPPSKVVAANIEQLVQEETSVEPVEEHVADDNRDDGCRLGDFVDNAIGVFEGLNEHVDVGDSEHPFVRDPSLGKKHDKYKKLAEEKIYPSCENGHTTLSVIVELHHVKKTFGHTTLSVIVELHHVKKTFGWSGIV